MREILFVFGILAVCLACAVAIVFPVRWYQCSNYESVTKRETKLAGLSCFVKDGNQWYEWGEYKYRLASKGSF